MTFESLNAFNKHWTDHIAVNIQLELVRLQLYSVAPILRCTKLKRNPDTWKYKEELAKTLMALTVDQILKRIGSYGWYQKRLTLIIGLMEGVNMVYQILIIVFIAAEPNWRCVTNATNCTLEGSFRPGHANYHLRCKIARDQWEFEKGFTSVVTEYDLVCDRAYLAGLSSAVIFAGWFLAALVGGLIADKFGRRPIVIVFAFMISLWGFLISFPKVFWFYLVGRFFVGVSRGCAGGSMFILLTEYVGVKDRHKPGTIMWYSWPIAECLLALFAYLATDWRVLSIVLGVQGLPILLAWWFVPESARFLLLKGRVDECEEVLRKIAQVNKKEYPNERLHDPTAGGQTNVRLGNFKDLFRTMSSTRIILICWVVWTVNSILLYGISLGIPDLGGNMYLTFFLLSLSDFPGVYLSVVSIGRFGRKKSTAIPLLLTFAAALLTAILMMFDPGDNMGYYVGRIILVATARILGAISFDAVYVWTVELFPTAIRNIALGSSTAIARIGGFCAPFIARSNRVHLMLPYGIMGVLCLIAGGLCLTLPETKGVATAETVDDNNNLHEMNANEKQRKNDVLSSEVKDDIHT